MPEKRFYLNSDLTPQLQCELIDEEAQHLKVMRCREGDVIEIINGKGVLALAKILQFGKREATLEILSAEKKPKPKFEIILAQALPRINRLDTILEKCTELGVSKILLFPGDHSEKKDLSPTQLQRIEHILVAASKQCGRLYLPEYEVRPKLSKWTKPEGQLFYGDVAPNAPTLKTTWKQVSPTLFFVGPEQGFTEAEESILEGWNASGIKLHENILRTDTAPIAAISLMSYLAN